MNGLGNVEQRRHTHNQQFLNPNKTLSVGEHYKAKGEWRSLWGELETCADNSRYWKMYFCNTRKS